MRSRRPTFPNASCATARSMNTIEPEAARAAPDGAQHGGDAERALHAIGYERQRSRHAEDCFFLRIQK